MTEHPKFSGFATRRRSKRLFGKANFAVQQGQKTTVDIPLITWRGGGRGGGGLGTHITNNAIAPIDSSDASRLAGTGRGYGRGGRGSNRAVPLMQHILERPAVINVGVNQYRRGQLQTVTECGGNQKTMDAVAHQQQPTVAPTVPFAWRGGGRGAGRGRGSVVQQPMNGVGDTSRGVMNSGIERGRGRGCRGHQSTKKRNRLPLELLESADKTTWWTSKWVKTHFEAEQNKQLPMKSEQKEQLPEVANGQQNGGFDDVGGNAGSSSQSVHPRCADLECQRKDAILKDIYGIIQNLSERLATSMGNVDNGPNKQQQK